MTILLLGPSSLISITDVVISENVSNVNIETLLREAGWDGTSDINATIIVDSGVTVTSMTTGTFPSGSEVHLYNMGTITGASNSAALTLLSPVTIENAGAIRGNPAIAGIENAIFTLRGTIT